MTEAKKSVLITGGSRGLGRALSEALAARGHRVVMVARTEGPLLDAARAIREGGGDAHALVADVGEPGAAARIAGAAAAMVGPIDAVVHNASTLGPVPLKPLVETTDEELEEALAVNLVGAFRLTRAVVGSMVARGAGLILHVSSDASVEAYPAWGAYGVSKAGLDHLSRIWAAELDGTGVRVLAVDPGEMDTTMHADAIPDADPATLARPADVAARLVTLIEQAPAPSGARVVAATLSPAGAL
ncbi:MAG: SDR family oxidoreductase [Sandaracinaceae bacterium]|nr:SDR family oxidoreductase [Sandaracinaceae bacterium]